MIRMGTIMNFQEMLLEMLLEGKLEDTLGRHPTIPDDVKQNYLKQIPAQNAQHLDWVLSQHTKGNITSSHDINGILDTFNKVKDKLPKKQIHQYGSIDELHSAITPHQDNAKKTDNEKSKEGTETLYSSPTMTIKQHHNYESCVRAANLPSSNTYEGKAKWCISVGDGGGAGHYSTYTKDGFNPTYTIEHHYTDGTSSKHMLVYDHNKTQGEQELRNEFDHRPGFNDYSSTRPDLLSHYSKIHPELMKTPIAHLFSEAGREQYKKEAEPAHKKLKEILSNIPKTGMSDEEYMANFNEGLKKQQGGIHNELANVALSPTQLTHLIEHGNEGTMHEIAKRNDLSNIHTEKLANTSNMLVHHHLLQKPNLPIDTFNTIVKKAHPETVPKIIAHPKFNETHIDTVLNKIGGGDPVDLTNLLKRFHQNLTSPNIDKIISNGHEDTIKSLVDRRSNLKPHHIDLIVKTPFEDSAIHSELVRVHSDKLDKHHIDSLIDTSDGDVHKELLHNLTNELTPHHIEKLIYYGNHNMNKDIIKTIPDKLDESHITSLIDNGDDELHSEIIHKLSKKLEPHHISNLIDSSDSETHSELINKIPDKLDSTHIEKLIDSGYTDTHSELINKIPKQLNSSHIDQLIDTSDTDTDSKLINKMHSQLEPHHIKNLIINGGSSTHSELINKLSDKLDSTHIGKLIDYGNSKLHSKLINNLPNKLEPHHIANLIDTDINNGSIINNNYHKLSTESKKEFAKQAQSMKDSGGSEWTEYHNVHKYMGLNEWCFTNNNFEKLLKESLLT